MSIVLNCHHQQEISPYIGVDPTCEKPAIFCIQHDPHKSRQGLLHQMMPLSQFRRSINEKKFKMADKVSFLVEQYSSFMDDLIKQITELKLKKIVELSMLWLRELATNQEQYENLRKLYRNDYLGLACKDIHWLYFKVANNQTLENKKIEEIDCYKDICKVMNSLQSSVKAKILISQKVMQLEGVVSKGELLRRALPDRKILKENTKQILMQTLNHKMFELKYSKVTLKQNNRSFLSVFSKYPLVEQTNYNIFMKTKYSNILIGICNQQLKKSPIDARDLQYSPHSIAYNCSNGCLYRDGMFESGSAHLTKGIKQLELVIRVNNTDFLILLGKNIICRANIEEFKKDRVYLHLLMRTQGDSIEIDRDKLLSSESNQTQLVQPVKQVFEQIIQEQVSVISQPNILIEKPLVRRPIFPQRENVVPIKQLIRQNLKKRDQTSLIQATPMVESQFQGTPQNKKIEASINFLESMGLKKSMPLNNSLQVPVANKNSNTNRSGQSKVFINMEESFGPSEAEKVSSKYASQAYDQIEQKMQQKQQLINPAIILPLRKSQYQLSLRSSANQNLAQIPSAKLLKKKASELTSTINGFKITQNQMEQDWI